MQEYLKGNNNNNQDNLDEISSNWEILLSSDASKEELLKIKQISQDNND